VNTLAKKNQELEEQKELKRLVLEYEDREEEANEKKQMEENAAQLLRSSGKTRAAKPTKQSILSTQHRRSYT
jgi:hypothetical protein